MAKNIKVLFKKIREGDCSGVYQILSTIPELINESDVNGVYPIHVCTEVGDIQILKMLVETCGAGINERTVYGNTPMHIAAKNGQVACMMELKRLGADVTLENYGHESIIDFIKHYEVEIPDGLIYRIFDDNSKEVDLCL
jgi:ankyrin repeat protein